MDMFGWSRSLGQSRPSGGLDREGPCRAARSCRLTMQSVRTGRLLAERRGHIKIIRRAEQWAVLSVCLLYLPSTYLPRGAAPRHFHPSRAASPPRGLARLARYGQRLLMIHWLVSPTARHAALSRAQCTASLADHSKVYTSTVALVPPEEAWLPIQQARESLRDKGLYRWPPHINLLYPFVPEEHFAQAADALAPAAAATPSASCCRSCSRAWSWSPRRSSAPGRGRASS